ncbi:MAG TPA: hypothetical protein VGT61_11520 [Thermomicrobiales bacterium]|jgi:hypothetical protein|nr:hypothetical protein [Thermomicrobiales bacterium]
MRIGKGNRTRSTGTSPRIGPTPFSAEWIDAPPPPERPRRLPVGNHWLPATLPDWFPSERLLTSALVLILVLSTAAFATAGGGQRELPAPQLSGPTGNDTQLVAQASASEMVVAEPTEATEVVTSPPPADGAAGDDAETSAAAEGAIEPEGPESTVEPADTPAVDETNAGGGAGLNGDQTPVEPEAHDEGDGLLPDNRIVAVYGFPTDANMGVLGEYGPDDIQGLYDEVLMPLVNAWEEADPSRPVIPAFEIIFAVAQVDAQSDGSYLAHASYELVEQYLDFAAANDMIVLIDTQMGMNTIEEEVEYMLPLLEHPNAHLAIDPEFSMNEGEITGEHIGQMDASEITWAQERMAQLSAEMGIPEKIVMVHQFHYTMIENKENIIDVPGVELVIHADGHGDPASKEVTYEVMVTQWIEEIPFFAGFKVWLNNDNGFGDEPRMEPTDMMLLNPAPDVITYQ